MATTGGAPPISAKARPGEAAAAAGERQRRLALFLVALAVALGYPFVDQALGLRAMGSVIPIMIYVLLALGLNIVVGFAGLLDLGYAAFFAIGAYTAAFLTSPVSPLPMNQTNFWIAIVISFLV